jgi:FkbM family methyltransferase
MMLPRPVERLARRAIYRFLPRGTDLFLDLRYQLPRLAVEVVFDVGANAGQSARDFLGWFPGSRIYCFEPVRETYARLRDRYRGQNRVRSFPLALGAEPGTGTMVREGISEQFRLVDAGARGAIGDTDLLEEVPVSTVDEFCVQAGVDRIGYLKIDTEGADLDVLRGAGRMLAEHRIDLVQVEAGMNRGNDTHVPFGALKDFLEARGYFLFGVYEQVPEWPTGQPYLRRSNLVFVAGSIVAPRS